jgi:SGNH domain (fused to AT3 domains)
MSPIYSNESIAKYALAILVDPQAVQCQGDHCTAAIDGAPIDDDTHHLNGFGSNALAHLYLEHVGNPHHHESLPRKH